MRVVDTHLHIWDLEAGGYAWLGPQHGPLHRSFLPDEAGAVLADAGVASAVLVQAEDSLRDTEYLLGVADQHAWVAGVVGWIQLDNPDEASRQLDELDNPLLVGIRHLVHDDPRRDFLDLPAVRRSLRLIADRGLVFDVPDAWPCHLDQVTRLAQVLPVLTVVVDHLAKPPLGGNLAGWERSLRAAAAEPNVVAKLSGLQQPGRPMTAAELRPVLDVAMDAFGADRLMYGGDWPMTVSHGGYAEALTVTRELIAELSTDERDALWHGTADRVYGRSRDV